MRAHEILLVEDNPADATLVREALEKIVHPSRLTCSNDGEKAVAYLRGTVNSAVRPDLIILDLNIPKKDGGAILAEVKADPDLRRIPIVVFSTSQSERDIARSYELGANCYVTKPIELQRFFSTVQGIVDFWYGCAKLPQEDPPDMNQAQRGE
jgi:chemotaxis family two-component system response regulator Rcp1